MLPASGTSSRAAWELSAGRPACGAYQAPPLPLSAAAAPGLPLTAMVAAAQAAPAPSAPACGSGTDAAVLLQALLWPLASPAGPPICMTPTTKARKLGVV